MNDGRDALPSCCQQPLRAVHIENLVQKFGRGAPTGFPNLIKVERHVKPDVLSQPEAGPMFVGNAVPTKRFDI